jgi:hypothetical protein
VQEARLWNRFWNQLAGLPPRVEVEFDEEARILRARRGEVELVADFANATAELRR